MKFEIMLLGLIVLLSYCRPPKITNKPYVAIANYVFYKSKHQVQDLLDSLVKTKDEFFLLESNTYLRVLLNYRYQGDTITFSIRFLGDDLEWVDRPDSTHLLLASIYKYKDEKSEERTVHSKLDSLKIMFFRNIFDSLIVSQLKVITEKAQAYNYSELGIDKTFPRKWQICKDPKSGKCDTIYIDDYIKGRHLGRYEIIPKDSLK